MSKNGVCKRNSVTGVRSHTLTLKVDGFGREFVSCDKCGFAEVVYKRVLKAIDFIN